MKIKLGDRELDLAGAFPLTLGDWRRLKERGVMDEKGELNVSDPANLGILLYVILSKAYPDLAEEEFDQLPITAFAEIGKFFSQQMEAAARGVDRPS